MLTRMIHQSMEPQPMPSTRNSVCQDTRPWLIPNPVRTARNDNTVVGLVRVSRNVETKSEWSVSSRASLDNGCGRLK